MNLFADDIKYIARVLEGFSLIWPESNDNSVQARVDIMMPSFGAQGDAKVQSIGKVLYKGDNLWAFVSQEELFDVADNSALTDGDIFKLPLSAAGKAYIKNLKEAVDYIGTTMGFHVHITLSDAFNKDAEIGYVSNRSGLAQYYAQD